MFETIEALTRSFREAHGLQLGTNPSDGRKVLVLKLDKQLLLIITSLAHKY